MKEIKWKRLDSDSVEKSGVSDSKVFTLRDQTESETLHCGSVPRDRNERGYFGGGGDDRRAQLGSNGFKAQVGTSRWRCPVGNWRDDLRGDVDLATISM